MSSIINKLFNGNLKAECENLLQSALYERNKKLDKLIQLEEELLKIFNESEKGLFDKWREALEGIWCDEVDLAYERGFKTGALLMIEIHDFEA